MAFDSQRTSARLAAFELIQAVQVGDADEALALAEGEAIAHDWPEVTRLLLYADYLRADLRADPGLGEYIERLRAHAEAAGDRAMLSVALASRAEFSLGSDDPVVRRGVDNDLARATALVQLSTEGAMERATAYIACAIAYGVRDLWELEEEMYAAVTPILAECELRILDAAVLCNRAEAALRLLCGLREVNAIGELRQRRQVATVAMNAALLGPMPQAWAVEVPVYAHLLHTLIDGRVPRPTAEVEAVLAEALGEQDTPMTGLLHLADALCAADSGDWRAAADLSERAINVMPSRYATSACALALRLAAQAEAALNDVGAVHALRYADYCSDRHWESRTQMVNAARANMHTEQLRIERDTHARNAMVDELTGLANRRGYNRHVERLNRRQAERPLAVLLVDIDDFKSVNDTYGHAAGDQVLARVAYALSQGTRPTDLVARLGGDEFVALIDNGDPEVAHQRATDLLARLSVEPWNLVARDLSIAVSIGVAVSKPGTEHGGDYERLVRRADAALYVAKARGGNRVEVAHGDRMIDRATTTDL